MKKTKAIGIFVLGVTAMALGSYRVCSSEPDVKKFIGMREAELRKEVKIDSGNLMGPGHGLDIGAQSGQLLLFFERFIDGTGPVAGPRDFTVLDVLVIPPKGNTKRALCTADCKVSGKSDPEIIALTEDDENKEWLTAFQAWRANGKTGKIEPISPQGIQCMNQSYGID